MKLGGQEELLNYIQVDCRRLLLIDESVSSVISHQINAVREAILDAGIRRNHRSHPVNQPATPADDLANIEPEIPDDLDVADDQPRVASNIEPVILDDLAVGAGQLRLAANIEPVLTTCSPYACISFYRSRLGAARLPWQVPVSQCS